MAPTTPRSSSSSIPPSRRATQRSHSDSYHPIYAASAGSSTSSDTSSIFSLASSSSSASSSTPFVPHRPFSRELPHVPRPRPLNRPAAPPAPVTRPAAPSTSISVPLCSPATGDTQVVLPRTLARPQPKQVSAEALAAAGADLASVPLPYIIQSLKDIGPRMMATLARTTAPVPTSLPRSLDVLIAPDPDPIPSTLDTQPTHLLAVYARSNVEVTPAQDGVVPKRKVTLFPTHAVMLAAHCAHLPPLPPGGKGKGKEQDTDGGSPLEETHPPQPSPPPTPPPVSPTTLTLPVVPLCIPAPNMFPVLQAYLYTKRADQLLGALVPSMPAPVSQAPSISTPTPAPIERSVTRMLKEPDRMSLVGEGDLLTPRERASTPSSQGSTPTPSHQSLTPTPSTPTPPSTPPPPSPSPPALVPDAASLAAQLATAHSPATIVRSALRTHGLWADAAALGVFDERLWLTIDFAWRVLLGALERGRPSPSVSPVPLSASEDGDEDDDDEMDDDDDESAVVERIDEEKEE